jgi:hypothetical protein
MAHLARMGKPELLALIAEMAERHPGLREDLGDMAALAGDDALRPFEPAGTPDGDASRARLATERERFGLPPLLPVPMDEIRKLIEPSASANAAAGEPSSLVPRPASGLAVSPSTGSPEAAPATGPADSPGGDE